ncbi:flavin reductase family protein [Shinella sp. AETb1-6]|uniref:Flavin reductase family protein n=1 Tax=Shinella sumterensis TaxID=1967501 RepID=A0AA50CN93_9HYPH|nr:MULTISPECIES: flavin reductase family protein [Shinella]MCD1266468.1 flavin reductase family protein [Shinella sumterensis]MXN53545.1 flavin reductase family protein [Shinella sp. AETb1-6]TFE94826.1 flavin reductase [Shinella sumterensis]WLR99155.1 flavin reductase family protein [Shinella sumterensis]
MFYETAQNAHGLRHDPFKAIVAPRPIGWIGTKAADGRRNLSPYSFFNAVADRPKLVMFSSSGHKDSVTNIEETGVFTCSLAGQHLAKEMNASSVAVPRGVDEFEIAGLTPVGGRLVDAPYVGEAYAALECRTTQILRPLDLDGRETDNWVVFGQVVGIHISPDILRDGMIDMAVARPLGRMGYLDYTDGGTGVFTMARPRAD